MIAGASRHHPEVGAAKAAPHNSAAMKLQISLEILLGMLLSLLIAASVLHSFLTAHELLAGTQSALSAIAGSLE